MPFAPECIGSDWRGQEHQIDVMAVNWREAQVLMGEAKWGEERVDHTVYAKLKERAEQALAYLHAERKGEGANDRP